MRSYATAHPTFPHESTADQWFTESQFESYRSLGFDIAQSSSLSADIALSGRTENTLSNLLAELAPTHPRRPAGALGSADAKSGL